MSYTFVKTKRDISLDKDTLEQMFEEAPENAKELIAELPDLQGDNQQEVLEGLEKIVEKLSEHPKLKEQLYCIISYLLNTQADNPKCLQGFFEWFMKQEDQPLFKVKICSLLFKSVNSSAFKKQLLTRSIQILAREKKIVYLASFLQDLDQLLRGLQLSNTQIAEVYLHIIKSLQEYPIYKKLVVQFIVKFLLITSPTDKENIDRFLGYLIGHSTVDEKMVAVGQSDTLKTYDSLMFKLFKIYLAGDLDSYTKLAAENAEEISKLGIDNKDYIHKLKVQYIAKLAHESKVISYQQFAKRLQIDISQVEKLIIYAIENSVVSASLDEFSQTITIKQVKSQYFSQSEWPNLLKQIDSLIAKLESFH